MARYIHPDTTDIRNSFGGVVYGNHGPNRVMRSKSIPRRSSSTRAFNSAQTRVASSQVWQTMSSEEAFYWSFFTAYWYEHGAPVWPKYHDSYTNFTASYAYANALGTVPDVIGADVNPPSPSDLQTCIFAVSGGRLTVQAFMVGTLRPGFPFVCYITPNLPSAFSAAPTTGGLCMGGGIIGDHVDITDAYVAAFGTQPVPGAFLAWRAVALYPVFYSFWNQAQQVDFIR